MNQGLYLPFEFAQLATCKSLMDLTNPMVPWLYEAQKNPCVYKYKVEAGSWGASTCCSAGLLAPSVNASAVMEKSL